MYISFPVVPSPTIKKEEAKELTYEFNSRTVMKLAIEPDIPWTVMGSKFPDILMFL